MRKLVLSFLLVMTSVVMFAQNNYREVVYLKNGSIIKGVIIEQVPNQSVKIQTNDGSVFVYPMSEVEKITKEIAESTPTKTPFNSHGKMERDGKYLSLNGRELTDDQVLSLVGEDKYETYLSAQKQINVGRAFTPVFWVSLGATVGLIASAYIFEERHHYGSYYYYGPNEGLLLAGYITGAVADVSLPLMCIFKGIGKGRLNWVADEYNKGNSSFSYNLSPSIIRCSALPEQASVGLGMTFSVNF